MTKRLLQAVVFVAALFTILVAWKCYSKAEKWSWYTLLVTGIIAWGSALSYYIAIGRLMRILIHVVGIVLFVIAIALPGKAILSGKTSKG